MRTTRTALLAALALGAATALTACGDLQRNNPFDPQVNGGVSLRDQLLGQWSRIEDEANEIYTFSAPNKVELYQYSSLTGDAVDRNAPYPTTRVRIFSGTFRLNSNRLEIFFTQADSNDPDDTVRVPTTEQAVDITIRRTTLTFEADGSRYFYTRLSP